jgi:16S rRNA (guanine527-N7)-methyltransferase
MSHFGVQLPQGVARAQVRFAEELLRWNTKVNLTAITELRAVVEKHLIDSLTLMPLLVETKSLLDLGAGAGLPGIPLALALPGLEVTLVDAVAKKIGFIKHAAAQLGLSTRVKAIHARAAGNPEGERLPLAEVVVSRALMDVGPWLKLAAAYVRPEGRVLAMLGKGAGLETQLQEHAAAAGFVVRSMKHLTLPFSGDPRTLVEFGPA